MPPVLHLSLPVHDLTESRDFYVDILGCDAGRVRDDWIDVWFHGMQVTLQVAPEEVTAPGSRSRRHFGVTLDRAPFEALVARLTTQPVRWISGPTTEYAGTPREQTKAMIADPSGNAIELKTYLDPIAALETSLASPHDSGG